MQAMAPVTVPPAKVLSLIVSNIQAGRPVYLTETAAKHLKPLLEKLGARLRVAKLSKNAKNDYLLIRVEAFNVFIEEWSGGTRVGLYRIHLNKLKKALEDYIASLEAETGAADDADAVTVYEVEMDEETRKLLLEIAGADRGAGSGKR